MGLTGGADVDLELVQYAQSPDTHKKKYAKRCEALWLCWVLRRKMVGGPWESRISPCTYIIIYIYNNIYIYLLGVYFYTLELAVWPWSMFADLGRE